MSVEPLDKAFRKIYESYDRNPLGWRVLITKDEEGFPTIVFLTPKGMWELKLDSLYKEAPFGFGIKLNEAPSGEIASKCPSYGFRLVEENQLDKLMESCNEEELSNIINKILSQRPMSLRDINGGLREKRGILHGPLIYTSKFPRLSEKQVKLDIKLRAELRKLIQRKGIASLYV